LAAPRALMSHGTPQEALKRTLGDVTTLVN
jgi:hypothetical protein